MRSIKKIDLLMKVKRSIRYLKIKSLAEAQLQGYILYIRLVIFFVFLMMPQIIRADTLGNVPEFFVIEQAATGNINITVEPEFPITGEITRITASGTWHNSCVPKFHSATISNTFGGQDATIQGIISEEDCDNVDTAWSLTRSLVFEEAMLTILQFTVQSGLVDNESQSASVVRYANTYFFVHDGITFQQPALGIDEPIQITISGWTASGCIPIYQSHTIQEKTIAINISTPESIEVCGQSPGEWNEKIDIGSLPIGRYRVEAHVRDFGETSPKLLHAKMLTVGDPTYQVFMPIIESNMKPSTGEPCSVDTLSVNLCY